MNKDMLINNGETRGKRRFNGGGRKGSMISQLSPIKRVLHTQSCCNTTTKGVIYANG